ncbi:MULTISPECIES: tetratricopeptide repeat protein [Flavobacterium]|uniref:tetratricopeptide repeat protein n=1 Tax=Flavobacterium TaxID=237 RepID=UPI001FCA68C4|nr:MULTISPECIES: tetratricopeptide repeat protein [Flavobacterium]UOK43458.1 helix-turn-helix domain-containing protein [Flavobacterium enshiense]
MMRLFLFFMFFVFSNTLFSQGKGVLNDERASVLEEKIKSSFSSNIDSAYVYASQLESSDDPSHKAFSTACKAYFFQLKSSPFEADKYYQKSLIHLEKVSVSDKKTSLNAFILNIGGLIDWRRTDYNQALEKYQKGRDLSLSIDDYMQVIKFDNNIAMINAEVGNYKQAIAVSREVNRTTDKIKHQYTEEQFIRDKGNVYMNLASFYEQYYFNIEKNLRLTGKNEKADVNFKLLDSAEYFYKKVVTFSSKFTDRKIRAQINLANIYNTKKDFATAEKVYYNLILLTKNNNFEEEYYNTNFNLGNLYYTTKRYDKALTCFHKVDSIYNIKKMGNLEFIMSNYYQSKIYSEKNDALKAYKHSEIYLDAFEKNESKITKEVLEVNYSIGLSNLKKEMDDMQVKYKNKVLLRNGLYILIFILFVALLFVLLRNVNQRKEVEKKISSMIAEHKANLEKNNGEHEITLLAKEEYSDDEASKNKLPLLSIDEEKENEIVRKLINLEKKQYYLNPDFTQQVIAKKIKTNTTYLSYVVNKRFGKTFSEYANELKINYVINEMITNSTYRKYSTQAMAESVGYKNAVSFTKSFSKRTGVTPVRFIKKIEEEAVN